ncbi:IMPACT family protein [Acinetobacter sp. A3.8]|uniref:IMPACT family protein n=1 Tax=Acinetobacter sedimenti TaxID=2919922 RepID=A0A9X2BB96_9GAMM|nr:YigZ family protein [Acinetobacter sedimenti]MCJ8147340.1 IMPACT family protein [Acinetobacter sedimenti]
MYSISAIIEANLEVKKSRFQAFAVPVSSEQAVKDFLESYRDHTTTHQCWAWKIGHDVRFNDDGEPSGTAGRPILTVIEGQNLTNVLILVNRWYGGVKLGKGGLVRAYGGCASQAIQLAERIELIATQSVQLHCEFGELAKIEYELQQLEIAFQADYLADGVLITAEMTDDQIDVINPFLQNLTRGREQLSIQDNL